MSGEPSRASSNKAVNGAIPKNPTTSSLSVTVSTAELSSNGREDSSMSRCLDEDQVIVFTRGRASEEERLRVEQHLGECEACLSWIATMLRGASRDSDNALCETLPMLQSGAGDLCDILPINQSDKDSDRYRLVAKIGNGSMGVVYRAYDRALHRQIALKLIRGDSRHASSSGLKVRLIAEAQALAKLTHPNVVAVHDLGLMGDQIFVAMELLEGKTLRLHLQETGAGWRETIACYLGAARGLEAAHARGLVHRDFKPDNVLVSGSRVVVTDFGLVRTVYGDDDKPAEAGPVGTPAYMAPEQFRGEPADERTDIFNFCASVYESLYHEPAFAGDSAVERRAAVLADSRRVPSSTAYVPGYVRDALLKGLAHDRAERFASMGALIEILSDAISFEARRRRHRLFAGLALGAVALAFLITLVWQRQSPAQLCRRQAREFPSLWARQARPKVLNALAHSNLPFQRETAQTLEAVLNRYVESWSNIYAQQCGAAFGAGPQSFTASSRLMCLDQERIAVNEFVDVLATADRDAVTRAVTAALQLEPPESCSSAAALGITQPTPDTARSSKPIQESYRGLGVAVGLQVAGKYDRAAASAEHALKTAQTIQYAPLEADALFRLASIRKDQGQWPASERLFSSCVDAAERARNDLVRARAAIELVDVVGYRQSRIADGLRWAHQAEVVLARIGEPARDVAALMAARGLLHLRNGTLDDAEKDLRAAAKLRQQVLSANDPLNGVTLANLGIVLQTKGKYWEAGSYYRQAYAVLSAALGVQHPRSAAALVNVGYALYSMGHFSEAKLAYEQALASQTLALGPQHPYIATTLMNIANVYDYLGDRQQALSYGKRAVDILKVAAPDSDQLMGAQLNIADYLAELGQFDRAQEIAEDALVFRKKLYGDTHPAVGNVEKWIAKFYLYQRRLDDALQHARLAQALIEKGLGKENAQLADILNVIGVVQREQGQPNAALATHRQALAILILNGGGPQVATTRTNIGLAEIALGFRRDALVDLELAMRLRAAQEGDPEGKAETEFSLARALYDEPHESGRATRLAYAALDTFSNAGLRWAPNAREVRRWVARHGMDPQPGETK